ncbi:ATP-binding protein [Streptomyces iconiensis]|uniref:ATP-binding protein n=1 Tax=Streptomyces iconiensis TaxID=1384038 RepID=UPI003D2F6DD4
MFVQRFSATRRGARLARRLAAYQLNVWGVAYDDPLSEAVTLIVAELSANAVLHGHVPGRDFELRLSRERGTGLVRVEVSDTHPALPVRRPRVAGASPEAGSAAEVEAEAGAGADTEAGTEAEAQVGVEADAEVYAEVDAEADGGRGLVLVEALASRWDVSERSGPGKTVWAEVDPSGAAAR